MAKSNLCSSSTIVAVLSLIVLNSPKILGKELRFGLSGYLPRNQQNTMEQSEKELHQMIDGFDPWRPSHVKYYSSPERTKYGLYRTRPTVGEYDADDNSIPKHHHSRRRFKEDSENDVSSRRPYGAPHWGKEVNKDHTYDRHPPTPQAVIGEPDPSTGYTGYIDFIPILRDNSVTVVPKTSRQYNDASNIKIRERTKTGFGYKQSTNEKPAYLPAIPSPRAESHVYDLSDSAPKSPKSLNEEETRSQKRKESHESIANNDIPTRESEIRHHESASRKLNDEDPLKGNHKLRYGKLVYVPRRSKHHRHPHRHRGKNSKKKKKNIICINLSDYEK